MRGNEPVQIYGHYEYEIEKMASLRDSYGGE
jgi:hypothetical protein